MASKKPIVKQVALLSFFPQLALLMGMIFVARWMGFKIFIIPGALMYLAISLPLRFGVPHHHRKGISLFKKGLFEEAIPFFEKSYSFFKRNSWIDKYRYIVLLSSSQISYTEMALLNIAFCYGQSGDGKKSKTYYEKALAEFPDSEIAETSLQMFQSAENIVTHDGEVNP
jgi:tetratricopeptide (TPR) repeat protein